MSLFGSIQLAGNTLRAADIGLQVVGNNIANANTPGYARQEVQLVPAPSQRIGLFLHYRNYSLQLINLLLNCQLPY